MRKIFAVFFFLSASVANAECPVNTDIDIETSVTVDGVNAGGHHGKMDVIHISMPLSIRGLPFHSIELTQGEVASYWLPLATEEKQDSFVTTFSGHADSVKDFEFLITYTDGECVLSTSESLYSAYMQLKK